MPRKSALRPTAAVTSKLRAMFKTLESRPVPDTIRSLVDQLDDGETVSSAPKKARKRG